MAITTLDLKKVICVHFYWRNQHSNIFTSHPPKSNTANGIPINDKEYAPYVAGYELETLIERARRLDIVDKWIPVIKVKMQGGVRLEFEGKKAKTIWKSWNAKIFAKKQSV